MKNKICKCGHIRNSHRSYVRKGVQSNYLHCLIRGCPCKKFKPQEEKQSVAIARVCIPNKNHSPSEEIKELKLASGGDSPKKKTLALGWEKPEDTLSSKIENCMCKKYNCGYKKLRIEDIKEFIKKLKGLFCWYSDKEPPYYDDCPNCKRINKLAGAELT